MCSQHSYNRNCLCLLHINITVEVKRIVGRMRFSLCRNMTFMPDFREKLLVEMYWISIFEKPRQTAYKCFYY
jgi:hypothetical protein